MAPMSCALDGVDGVDEVVQLRLDHEHHRGVAEAGVGTDQEEQVRESVHGGALVSLLPLSSKTSARRASVLADDACEGGGVGDVEAGGDDDRVDLADGAVLRRRWRSARDLGDAVGDQVDVRPIERRVVVVRDQHALAADLEVRGDLAAQISVADLRLRCALARRAASGFMKIGALVRPTTWVSRIA